MHSSVPRIDFSEASLSKRIDEVPNAHIRELSLEILDAFQRTGFLVLFNHGVDLESLHGVRKEVETFFAAESDVKKPYLRSDPTRNMFGYTPPDLTQEVFDANKPKDHKETFEFSLWGQDEVPTEKWHFHRQQLASQMGLLFERFLTLFAIGLGLENTAALTKHVAQLSQHNGSGNLSAFRAALYPEIQSSDILPNQERCGLHCDYGALTFIYKAPFEKGLLSKERKGDFMDVFCVEDGDLIVNAGECLQMLTGDTIRAAPHKVVFPHTTADQHGRVPPAFSFIFFGLFDNDAEIETIDCTATNTKYDKFRFGDYFNMRLTNVFVEGKGLVPELLEQ